MKLCDVKANTLKNCFLNRSKLRIHLISRYQTNAVDAIVNSMKVSKSKS